MTYAAFALVAVLALTLIYQYMVRPAAASAGGGTREGYYAEESALILMHMTGCGWCDRLMPTWDSFAQRYDGKGLRFKKFEAKDEAGAKYKAHVAGFPTILLEKADGTIVKFEGDRSVEGMKSFLRANGVSILEGFAGARRVQGGASKQWKETKTTVASNSGSKEQTDEMSKNAGMKLKK